MINIIEQSGHKTYVIDTETDLNELPIDGVIE